MQHIPHSDLRRREFIVVTSFATALASELTPVLGDRVHVCESGEEAMAAVGAGTTHLFADFQALPDRWTGLRLARWVAARKQNALQCWLMVDSVRDFHLACAQQAGAAGAVARTAAALLQIITETSTATADEARADSGFPELKQSYKGPAWREAVNEVFQNYAGTVEAKVLIDTATAEGMVGDHVDGHLYVERLATGLSNLAERAAFCNELRTRQLIQNATTRT